MNKLDQGPFSMPGSRRLLPDQEETAGNIFSSILANLQTQQPQPQVGQGSVMASMGGPSEFGQGMVQPTPEMMQATTLAPESFEALPPEAAGGMSGMQKAAMAAQLGGGINDAIMRMQTRAPTARGARMDFGRRGPTVAEQFRRGGGR